MTEKQQEQFKRMHTTLRRIAQEYASPDQLRKQADKQWGLSYPEALAMSYENIQEEAKEAIRGVRLP